MLLLPVVRFAPALKPNAMLLPPVVLLKSACQPLAVLEAPVVLLWQGPLPGGGVVGGRRAALKRVETAGRVPLADRVVHECIGTVGCVVDAGCEARERPAPFCGVTVVQV